MGYDMSSIQNKVSQGIPLTDELVIDAHCHMGYYPNFNVPAPSAADMVRWMDRLGVKACVAAHHASIGPDFRYGNDEVLQAMADFPGRIYGYATVNPNYPESELVAELERCISVGSAGVLTCLPDAGEDTRAPSMVGVKLHPDLHQTNVDDDKYRAVWEWTNAHRLPLLSHTSTGGRNAIKTFEKLAEMYPNVSILLGHSGFGSEGAQQCIEACLKFPNLYCEITGSTIVYGTLERMVNRLGAERVLFGTDLPFLDARPQVGRVAFAKISDDDKRKVFGRNAARIFGITSNE